MLLKRNVPPFFYLRNIKYEMLVVICISVVIGYLHKFQFAEEIAVPYVIPTVLGTAISLLLAFRTNQSYERWWEARKIWGAVVNDSRSITRQLINFTGFDLRRPAKPKLAQMNLDEKSQIVIKSVQAQATFCQVLARQLRGLDTEQLLAKYFSGDDYEYLKAFKNRANAILLFIGRQATNLYQKSVITDFQLQTIESSLVNLTTQLGKCERIKNTPFPQPYSVCLHAYIYIFAAILPLALLNFSILEETLLSSTLSIIFLLIEKTAILKEDPFENRPTDISMNQMANNIERSIMEMLGENVTIAYEDVGKYYVL